MNNETISKEDLFKERIEQAQRIEELININEKLSLALESTEKKLDIIKKYCEEVIKEHENGEYNVSTTQLAIKEHKGNIQNILNILNN